MTSHPPEPPTPPPPPEERPPSQAQRPGAPDEWRAFERPRGDGPGNGHRAASARGAPAPRADDPPENGHEPAPGYPPENGHELTAGHPPENGYELTPSQPPGPEYGSDNYPDYPPRPGYADLPDYPRDGYEPAGYPPMPDYPAAGYPPMPDYPPTPGPSPPGYPPTPDYLPPHGYRTAPGSPDAAYQPAGYPAAGHPRGGYPPGPQVAELPAADGSWVLEDGSWVPEGGSWVLEGGGWVLEGGPVTHEEYVHPGDGPATAVDAPAGATPADAAPGTQWAMLAYLTVPFFGLLVPLAVYLTSLRRSRWVRAHAAQAVNVWLTGILYDLSALILGAVLLLDSPRVALAVVVPLVIVLWLTTLAFLVRAAARASRGETYTFPRWLCAPMVR
jgi:uncharacterized Tic20 family protein